MYLDVHLYVYDKFLWLGILPRVDSLYNTSTESVASNSNYSTDVSDWQSLDYLPLSSFKEG